MKKSVIYLVFFLFTAPMVMAQEFNVGTNVITAGVGFGGNYGLNYSPNENVGLGFSYERGIWDIGGPGVISLGGYLGFKSYDYDYYDYDVHRDAKYRYTIIGARGAYHYNGLEVDNLDLYGGVMISYNILSIDNDYPGNNDGSELGATPFVGGRWFFTDNFGVFAELSYGVANFTLGVAFKF